MEVIGYIAAAAVILGSLLIALWTQVHRAQTTTGSGKSAAIAKPKSCNCPNLSTGTIYVRLHPLICSQPTVQAT